METLRGVRMIETDAEWVAEEIRDAVPGAQITEHVGLYQVWVASRYVNIWDDGADKLVWEFGDEKPSSKTDEERADEAAAYLNGWRDDYEPYKSLVEFIEAEIDRQGIDVDADLAPHIWRRGDQELHIDVDDLAAGVHSTKIKSSRFFPPGVRMEVYPGGRQWARQCVNSLK